MIANTRCTILNYTTQINVEVTKTWTLKLVSLQQPEIHYSIVFFFFFFPSRCSLPQPPYILPFLNCRCCSYWWESGLDSLDMLKQLNILPCHVTLDILSMAWQVFFFPSEFFTDSFYFILSTTVM